MYTTKKELIINVVKNATSGPVNTIILCDRYLCFLIQIEPKIHRMSMMVDMGNDNAGDHGSLYNNPLFAKFWLKIPTRKAEVQLFANIV